MTFKAGVSNSLAACDERICVYTTVSGKFITRRDVIISEVQQFPVRLASVPSKSWVYCAFAFASAKIAAIASKIVFMTFCLGSRLKMFFAES